MTPCTLRLLTLLQISIHTSAREVTQHKTKVQNIFSHFNPHFRKGSDGQDIDWTATEDDISIHTSAREVTVRQLLFTMSQNYFNPHFREGSDTIRNKIRLPHLLFQSTLPRGKWQLMMWTRLLICWFQSTLPRGKWLDGWLRNTGNWTFQSTLPRGKWHFWPIRRYELWRISIHTSAREVTWTQYNVWDHGIISIHTSAREVTLLIAVLIPFAPHFNPHFREGSDWSDISLNWSLTRFQSTLPRGKWLVRWWRKQDRVYFNPHFREGSDK